MRAIALVSGGLDSVVAAWAAREDYALAATLTIDYGQRAKQQEISAAERLAALLGCEALVVALPWLGQLGHSALTDPSAALPAVRPEQLDDARDTRASAAAVWVPNRNGVFLNVAAAYAEALDCDAIVCGFNAEEAATFPDNSTEFMEAATRFFALSTMRHPRVVSPTAGLSKADIVRLGLRIGAPLDLVWSCYQGGNQHCGECESCQRLKRALQQAGVWETWRASAHAAQR